MLETKPWSSSTRAAAEPSFQLMENMFYSEYRDRFASCLNEDALKVLNTLKVNSFVYLPVYKEMKTSY